MLGKLIGTGQITLTDLNDAIVSGDAPTNPSNGTLWVDTSGATNVLKQWNGSTWIVVGDLIPDLGETITDITETIGNMANDNILDYQERQIVKDKLVDIIGYVISNVDTTMPSVAILESSQKGSLYIVRRSAILAGVKVNDDKYKNVETQYNNLKSYLESMNPRPWDTSDTKKDLTIPVVKDDFRNKWLNYYNAVHDLSIYSNEKLKETIDKIGLGVNLAVNGNFETELNQSSWKNYYTGQVKEIVDISTETPPFKYAYHVKNDIVGNGGIFMPIVWDEYVAPSLVDKEVTISFWLKYKGIVKGNESFKAGRFGELVIEFLKSDGSKTYRYIRTHKDNTATDSFYIEGTNEEWAKYHATIKLSLPVGTTKVTKVMFKHGIEGCTGEFWTTGIKIELGDKVTDWAPNPFDLSNRISKAEFLLQDDQIVLKVTSSESFKTTIGGLNTRITDVESKVTSSAIISTVTQSSEFHTALGDKADKDSVFSKDEISQMATHQLLHNSEWASDTKYWTLDNGWKLDNSFQFEGINTLGFASDTVTSRYVKSENVPVKLGQKVSFSIYINKKTAGNGNVDIGIEYYDVTNTLINSSVKYITITDVNKWGRHSIIGELPTGTVSVKVLVSTVKGGINIAKPMLQYGEILSVWTPHIDELATELKSQISQTAGRVSVVVGSDNKINAEAIASEISITPDAINAISQNINLQGRVTFTSFDSSLQQNMNDLNGLTTVDGGKTVIDGNKIKLLGTNASISWSQVSNRPEIPTDLSDLNGYKPLTYIDSTGVYTGNIVAGQIKGGTISGNMISGGHISGTTISGNAITGGTITGTTINVDTDLKVGNTINIGDPNEWGSLRYLRFNNKAIISNRNPDLTLGDGTSIHISAQNFTVNHGHIILGNTTGYTTYLRGRVDITQANFVGGVPAVFG